MKRRLFLLLAGISLISTIGGIVIISLNNTGEQTAYMNTMNVVGKFVPLIVMLILLCALVANVSIDVFVKHFKKHSPNSLELASIYPELSDFIVNIRRENSETLKKSLDNQKRQEQFKIIVENINEGLILMGKNSEVLLINSTASRFLDIDPEKPYLGKFIMELSRSRDLNETVLRCMNGERSECMLSVQGRDYAVTANPVNMSGTIDGAVLLLLDITEKHEAEQLRKEFSANVSHELKTPLTSISGYAELLKSGMVASEDVIPFAEKIYTQTTGLIQLIQDIIYISRLDEQDMPAQKTIVDLSAIAKKSLSRLADTAEKLQINITSDLSSAKILGIEAMLFEIINNICENAVKYNKPGGSVNVRTDIENGRAVIYVKDTGIGIPSGSTQRVFERFYRVDKSHSKSTGGTGLGLSIVKHGTHLHEGKIDLKSKLGKGTTIRIDFPLAQ